ncbi:hypothetical protein CYMTET_14081 [Cymbomonas tetramitiformis]|uniref:Major facilitator superfamily (MFS) profile domain-containing protein n=1 Tax=Cymbomonas tetramitiformis TaxID=36881 RepID=A0AAE0GH14_9CHLO|nr:hypothetical protein CYMTET_14081 [Cymbomonas tetramitiformis]
MKSQRHSEDPAAIDTPLSSMLEAPLLPESSHIKQQARFRAIFITCIAPITGGFVLGVGYGNIGAILSSHFYKEYYDNPSDLLDEVLGGVLQVGSVGGSILAGLYSDRFGRRRGALYIACIQLVGAAVAALPLFLPIKTLMPIFVGRFLTGLANGYLSCAIPTYVCETAVAHYRGAIEASFQLFITVGILIAYVINWVYVPDHAIGWKISMAWQVVPSAIFMCAVAWLPESPRWLVIYGNDPQAASNALRMIRCKEDNAEGELSGIVAEAERHQEEGCGQSLWSAVMESPERRSCLVAMAIGMMQNGSGVDIVTVYAPQIFSEVYGTDSDESTQLRITVYVGIAFVLITPIAMLLVDRFGRRVLLLTGSAGMSLSMFMLAACHMALKQDLAEKTHNALQIVGIMAVMAFVAFFSISWGPVAWIVPSELVPSHLRARVVSVALVCGWILDYLVISTWLSLVAAVGESGGFIVYGLIDLGLGIFVFSFLKETKGICIEH